MALTDDQILEGLLTLPALVGARVPPGGRRVAWTWYRTGPAADVYAAPTNGSRPPVRLTDTPHDTYVTSWTPDSRAVIVSQDRDGDERAQLSRIDLHQAGDMQPLTEPSPSFFLRRGQLHPLSAAGAVLPRCLCRLSSTATLTYFTSCFLLPACVGCHSVLELLRFFAGALIVECRGLQSQSEAILWSTYPS
jgi:hypothetical protein